MLQGECRCKRTKQVVVKFEKVLGQLLQSAVVQPHSSV